MAVTAVKLKYSSTGHAVDGSTLDPTLSIVSAFGVVDVNGTLLTFVFQPADDDVARVAAWVECLLVSRLGCLYCVTQTLDLGDALGAPIGMSLKTICLGEGLGTVITEVEVGDLPDSFDVEGMLLEHTNSHDIGILDGLSNQTPDGSISGVSPLDILGGFVFTDT